MVQVRNCPTCNAIFNFNGLRGVCPSCFKKEEELFNKVYQFLRKRENRAATIDRIEEVTGAKKSLLHKWVRKRRLQPAQFPGLGYPCDNCGTLVTQGKLCSTCSESIKSDLKREDNHSAFKEEIAAHQKQTYLSFKNNS